MTRTHTYVTLDVPKAMYDHVAAKLIAAGYGEAVGEATIDMHGLALVVDDTITPASRQATVGECEGCHTPETYVQDYEVGPWARGKVNKLCLLCASTDLGTTVGHPAPGALYDHNAIAVMRTVCLVGNAILQAIRGIRR